MSRYSGSMQGQWAKDDTCYQESYKDCRKADGTRCEYWRGGCQAKYLPPPDKQNKEESMNDIKIFRLNEYEWYAGRTAEECIHFGVKSSGVSRDELCDEMEDPAPLSPEFMEKLIFIEEDDTEKTFAAKLKEMVDAGEQFPCLFATTEC